jgi:hypothetical protein
MRRLRGALLVAIALALLVPVGTDAFAFSDTYYAGHTSSGKKLLFVVTHTDSGDLFKPNFITFVETCEDGLSFTYGAGFSGFAIPVDDQGRFVLDLPFYPFEHFRWQGRLTENGAIGRVFDRLGAITVDDHAQLCGTLSRWTAKKLEPAAGAHGPSGTQAAVSFNRAPDGTVTMTLRGLGGTTTTVSRAG